MLNAFRHLRSIHKLQESKSMNRSSVLNAFRHLRSIHSVYGSQFLTRHRVLNAFRHLRSIHKVNSAIYKVEAVCSTPFGISDPFTKPPLATSCNFLVCSTPFGISDPFTNSFAAPLRRSTVLNAFRHLRSIHCHTENTLFSLRNFIEASGASLSPMILTTKISLTLDLARNK